MKNLVSIVQVLILMTAVGLISCDKTNVQEFEPPSTIDQSQGPRQTSNALAMRAAVNLDTTIQDTVKDEDGDGDYDHPLDECFEFIFPLDITLPGQGSQTVNSDEEIDDLLEKWFEENPNATEDPDLLYPIQVSRPDGSTLTIASEQVLDSLFNECYDEHELECDEDDWGYDDEDDWDDEDWDDYDDWEDAWEEVACVEFVFPLSVQLPNGDTKTAQNEEELIDIYEAWFEEILDGDEDEIEEFPTFVFPIEVIVGDSTRLSIQSEEELEDIAFDCFDEFFEDCFEIVFPITINLPDGTSVVANSYEECEEIFEAWEEQHPDSDEEPEIAFPIKVTLEDGTEKTVSSEEELEDLFDDCYEEWDLDFTDVLSEGTKAASTKAVLNKTK